MKEPAGGSENRFFLNPFDDAEPMIRVDDLVTELECHVSPVAGRLVVAVYAGNSTHKYSPLARMESTENARKTPLFGTSDLSNARWGTGPRTGARDVSWLNYSCFRTWIKSPGWLSNVSPRVQSAHDPPVG